MEYLCRLVIANETGEKEAGSKYEAELIEMGYEVRPSLDRHIRPKARVLVAPLGSHSLQEALGINDNVEVRLVDAMVLDFSSTGAMAVRTVVLIPVRPVYRTARFIDGTASGRLLTLGKPGGPESVSI